MLLVLATAIVLAASADRTVRPSLVLEPPGNTPGFGRLLAWEEPFLLVGTQGDQSVTLFERTAVGWMLRDTWRNLSTTVFSNFPIAVTSAGDWFFASDHRANEERGVVVVFRREGTRLKRVQSLAPASLEVGAFFGLCLSASGDFLVVGAPNDNGLRGAAYVYSLVGDRWQFQQEVFNRQKVSQAFGVTCDINSRGDLVVGEPFRDRVHIYSETDGTWSFEELLVDQVTLPPALGFDSFGRSVAMAPDGNSVAVGDLPIGNGFSTPPGDVTVFERHPTRPGGGFQRAAVLTATNGDSGGFPGFAGGVRFGESVEFVEGTIAVGASGADTAIPGVLGGSVYLFRKVAGKWPEVEDFRCTKSIPVSEATLGFSLAFDGSTVFSGANITSTGVFVFEFGVGDSSCGAEDGGPSLAVLQPTRGQAITLAMHSHTPGSTVLTCASLSQDSLPMPFSGRGMCLAGRITRIAPPQTVGAEGCLYLGPFSPDRVRCLVGAMVGEEMHFQAWSSASAQWTNLVSVRL